MSNQYTHADILREWLTGAASDGAAQTSPNLSFGNYRSATEVGTLGIYIVNAIPNVYVLFAGGANPLGTGQLIALDSQTLVWQPASYLGPGPAMVFSGSNDVEIVEAFGNPAAYLRVQATPPFTPTTSFITLSVEYNNLYAMDDVSIADATAGISEYRAGMLRNEGTASIGSLQRYLALLGTPQLSNTTQLGASGSGTLVTTGSFADWPLAGWCRIQTSGGAWRETVYYTSRTGTVLTVLAAGRALFGTSAAAGASTDTLQPIPGFAIAIDTAGVQASGSAIQTIANGTTAPTSVTWNQGVSPSTGLQIGSLGTSKEVGIWYWRQLPAGAIATPQALGSFMDQFTV